jgi:hypothetical protein
MFAGIVFKKIKGVIITSLLIFIMTVDFFLAKGSDNFLVPYETFQRLTPNREVIMKDKTLFRVYLSKKAAGNGFLEGDTYEDALLGGMDKLMPNYNIPCGIYDVNGYDSLVLANYSRVITLANSGASPSSTRMLDMLNVKYIVVAEKFDDKGYKFIKGDHGAYLYKNENVMPRAFLVEMFRVIKKEADVTDRLGSIDFDPVREVILEEEPEFKYAAQSQRLKEGGEEKVEIIKYSPNEVIVEASVESPKFMVLADQYYPGWKVYVDGKREKLYKANFILRAVYLSSGFHAVRFLFDPFTFKFGMVISILTFLIMLVLVIMERRDIIVVSKHC